MNRNREYEARLIGMIRDSFSRDELQYDVYVPLLIDYNEIEGETQKAKATELVKKCARDGRLPHLLAVCRELRPHIRWPEVEEANGHKKSSGRISPAALKELPDIVWALLGAIVILIIWGLSVVSSSDGDLPVPTEILVVTATPIPPTNTLISSPAPTVIWTATPIPSTKSPTQSPTPTNTTAPTIPPTFTPTALPTATRDPHHPPDEPVLGDWWIRETDEMRQLFVPADTFWMGSLLTAANANKDEMPQHEVALTAFWLDKTEVTAAQFAIFLNAVGNQREHGMDWVDLTHSSSNVTQDNGEFFAVPGMDDKPITLVSWYGANAYCQWAGGQLPTEAQWEYAARGPALHAYPWGGLPPTCDQAQFRVCPVGVQSAGSKSPAGDSWLGAVDMGGNVWEWTADWYGEYETAVTTNPTGPAFGSNRVLRGGSWGSESWMTRTAYRHHAIPTYQSVFYGFRCVVPHTSDVYDNTP